MDSTASPRMAQVAGEEAAQLAETSGATLAQRLARGAMASPGAEIGQ